MRRAEVEKLAGAPDGLGWHFKVHSDLFEKQVPVIISKGLVESSDVIEDYQIDALNMFLNIDPFQRITVAQLLFSHCKFYNEIADYGIDRRDESHPCYATRPEDVFKKITGEPQVIIQAKEWWKNLYCVISFSPEWENEHGVVLVVKNGHIIAFADYQDYFYDFEPPGRNGGE
ncbi:MAG TPA: hypothetical protein VEJ63_06665 [Planctomycetota bacterium]|nr:hypothetical protein [Planctomycetota bacterium]